MASMTHGRVAAQCAHAQGAMEKVLPEKMTDYWNAWKGDRGFGTTIVLSNNDPHYNYYTHLDIADIASDFEKMKDEDIQIFYTILVDPEYPIKDGDVTHSISLATCLVFFVVDKNSLPEYIRELELYG